jgi:hypothetical protein
LQKKNMAKTTPTYAPVIRALCGKEYQLISGAVGKIIGLVLAHSVLIGSDLNESELLVPVVIYYQGENREIKAFEAETQQDAVNLAQEFLSSLSAKSDSWAYVQDGLITLPNGKKQDVYFIKGWAKGMSEPLELYQMYNTQPFKLVENIKVLNYSDTGLSDEDADSFIVALDEGIFSHPSATKQELEKWFK